MRYPKEILEFGSTKLSLAIYDKSILNQSSFYEEKIETANFFFNRVLPRVESYYLTATTGSKYIMNFKFN